SVSNDTLTRHELAHQRIGNLITIASRPDLRITEAGGTYFPQVSRVGRNNREQASYGLSRNMDRTRALNNPSDTNLFNTNLVYNRAARVYHHLRSYLGNNLYFSGLDYYINKHAHGTVSTKQLKNTWEEATNVNLSGFFTRFVYGTGSPTVRVTNFYDNLNDGTYSGRAFFKLSRTDNKERTPDVVFTRIDYTDGSSGEFRLFQENQDSYLTINTYKNISGIVIDPGSGTTNRITDYPGTISNSGFSISNDSDTDSLPDGWEYIVFGNLNQAANGDYDGDEITNIDEYDLNIENIDYTGPNFDFSNNSGYECSDGYLIISGSYDTGVGLHDIPYS
ncbi:MAG TPA: M1 family aminopeptidase, partial [Candidatus Absconditabacterales bacterium]|nr:M1 family aminopeptidase [Candidatus Absconditabacterales bacterium]